ncbi:MAG TPA: RlmI/RlmK family 23S rRNA methyltransferase [Bacteroidales bacterium]|nr:MAG: SAM-dependent methyltransferase [Bacteroidetes bacterium GWF2_33_38]OFY76515.1 MAG: SAM-dependent methyltransferase [Bacteroidetes bacterium RIFOXYA12_FULL_33_9]HBF89266.1 RlmI/RlmK family 23S rRNA methyltransferase [Bacteroidales bacterium]
MYAKVILKSGKDQSARRFHPWIFSGAIKKIKGEVSEGDIVEVYDNKEELLGIGHFQIGSIAVRIISFTDSEINENFWFEKIQKAYEYRKKLGITDNDNTNVYRLLHAEGDGMPGVIIDFYNGTAVIQMHSIGMAMEVNKIVDALKAVLGDKLKAVYNKSEATLPFKAEFKLPDGLLFGESVTNIVEEYGNKFKISWVDGQKTGFFIDQRENRKLLQSYSKGKKVLNVFGYTGGFSVYAMQGEAELVHSVDSSKKAIELTDENIKLNFGDDARHKSFAVDAFGFLEDIDDKYDVIILDPPAFAKHHNVLNNALQGYKRINAKAIESIKKGGILFTFSCSQVVTKENFRKAVFSAAASTGRNVKILHQLTQPVDHPVNIYHPEGEYLKGLVVYVE